MRSIPACAGEPDRRFWLGRTARVYPRVCGGTNLREVLYYRLSGLSPRVRGNRGCAVDLWIHKRSIPACAGEPDPRRQWHPQSSVYPRVCGEPPAYTIHGNFLRSIPACAGEPPTLTLRTFVLRVYPRVCGGTCAALRAVANTEGLSPRVRGNQGVSLFGPFGNRSIPACAGEPIGIYRQDEPGKVYPRVCGGTHSSLLAAGADVGLSPRVRGNPARPQEGIVIRRSIPACAGEPFPVDLPPPRYAVYPRVCGGTVDPLSQPPGESGLSPRVRGNPAAATRPCNVKRSIPACAGEPFVGRD